MDNNKHNDWTGAVRERLEGRELTPSDALWERIGAAVPQAGAPRKVRRLAWGGAAGVAAAAALAAVLFLRPAGGQKEDGRIDVVPTPVSTVAKAEIVENVENVIDNGAAVAEPEARPVSEQSPSVAEPEVKPLEEQSPVTEPTTTSVVERVADKSELAREAITAKTEETDSFVGFQPPQNDKSVTMSLEDFLAQEEKEKGPRRLTAAVYAAGRPSTDFMLTKDYQGDLSKLDNTGIKQSSMMYDADSATNSIASSYTTNPENPDNTNTIKYTNDPYTLNGERLNHSRPVSIGMALTYPLDNHLFLESGLYYSYLHSSSYRVDQTLHSIGVPLKLGYRIGSARRTSLALSAGAKAEKCVLALRSGERFKEPGIQLAAVGSAAIQYNFSPRLGLFVAPELSYWFTETELSTYNTEHPFNLSLKAGLNLSLGY